MLADLLAPSAGEVLVQEDCSASGIESREKLFRPPPPPKGPERHLKAARKTCLETSFAAHLPRTYPRREVNSARGKIPSLVGETQLGWHVKR